MANDPLRMAAATAFFTTFALPPILIIIVRTLGLFMDRHQLGEHILQELGKVLGPESKNSILLAIHSFLGLQHNFFVAVALATFLLFVATTLFKIIKGSLNQLWNIRKRPGNDVLSQLLSRAVSVGIILLGGLLFLALQFIINGQHMIGRRFETQYPGVVFYGNLIISQALLVIAATIWFMVLFLFMPDGRPHRKAALAGAFITSLLFNAGKWVLQILLRPGPVNHFYGTSGALVLVLLFVFYSSLILYFGAAFIRVYGEHLQLPLTLRPHVFRYRLQELPDDVKTPDHSE